MSLMKLDMFKTIRSDKQARNLPGENSRNLSLSFISVNLNGLQWSIAIQLDKCVAFIQRVTREIG